jgi:hypothetical protein
MAPRMATQLEVIFFYIFSLLFMFYISSSLCKRVVGALGYMHVPWESLRKLDFFLNMYLIKQLNCRLTVMEY